MKKILSVLLSAAMLVTALAACSPTEVEESKSSEGSSSQVESVSGEVTASGSSALKPLADIAAEKFMEIHDDATIVINAGGSGTGLKDVSAGTVDIGNSDLFAEEKLTPEQAAELVDHKVCTVTMAPIVNKDLGVTDLTADQLKDIFTGKVTNWKEVGGEDLAIMLITRPESSGTRATFQAYALGGESETVGGFETDNSGELVDKVKSNKGAIGYVAMSYFSDDIQVVSIDGVEATLENTYNGTYTVWSYEHMYTKGEAQGATKAFIDYMMSEEFSSEIEAAGYGAGSKLSAEAIATHEPKDADEKEEAVVEPVSGEVTASGSSALKPLADIAAEKFMEIHEDATIVINAGGSGTGLKDISAGTVDIGNSDLFAEEKLTPEQAAELVDHKVCTVTMAPIVNKDLGVTDLTADQLKDIFTGKVTNWKEVGGEDLAIMLITRPESSGTRATFQAYALGGEAETLGGFETDNSGELVDKVKSNKGAIGYVAMSYFSDDIQVVAIDGVEATLENTYNGTYTVWSYEHMYTKGEAEGATKAFIDYMMSDEFSVEIEAAGYGAGAKLSKEAIATHE